MKFPVIKTIPQFCKATGFPEDEFGKLRWSQLLEILAFYDLTLDFKFSDKK